MRSMLYAGAALMIGASIYGFVDYNRTSHKKEFKSMYNEKKAEVNSEVKAEPVIDQETRTSTKVSFTNKKKDPATIGIRVTDKDKKVAKEEPKKEVKKKRKFRFSEFSRAPLRDEEEKVVLDDQDTRKPDTTSVTHKKTGK